MAKLLDKILHRGIPDVRVIFNPSSGNRELAETQLEQVLTALREMGLNTRTTRIHPNSRIHHTTARAAKRGVPFIVVLGGDNTMDLAARGIFGTPTTLVVVPTGTRNNIAHSLELPQDVVKAVSLIQTGQKQQIDVGRVEVAGRQIFFLELMSIGLTAAMFPSMDQAQKGNLASIGDLLNTFISQPGGTFQLTLDPNVEPISIQALTLVVLNMPYLGANFQIATSVDYCDGLLDVFLYAELGKLDLLTHAAQVARGFTDDPRVRHLRVRQIEINTDPPLPVMLDGNVLSERVLRRRSMRLSIAPRMLNVMAPKPSAAVSQG